jgi:hypothetical protein
MKTIQTKSGEILLVEVPTNINLDTFSYSTETDIHFLTADGKDVDIYCNNIPNIKIIGKFSELEDKAFEEFVENDEDSYGAWYKNYNDKIDNKPPYSLETAQDSFISLCKFQGIEDDLNDYLIIKKI